MERRFFSDNSDGVVVNARTQRTRQESDAPPTHLQKGESDNQQPMCHTAIVTRNLTIMYINKVREPSCHGPSFLRIPRPIMPPRFLRPQCAEQHSDGEEADSDADEFVFDGRIGVCRKPIQRDDGRRSHQRVGRHVSDDVRHKPHALQGWNEGFGMENRHEMMDEEKDGNDE